MTEKIDTWRYHYTTFKCKYHGEYSDYSNDRLKNGCPCCKEILQKIDLKNIMENTKIDEEDVKRFHDKKEQKLKEKREQAQVILDSKTDGEKANQIIKDNRNQIQKDLKNGISKSQIHAKLFPQERNSYRYYQKLLDFIKEHKLDSCPKESKRKKELMIAEKNIKKFIQKYSVTKDEIKKIIRGVYK